MTKYLLLTFIFFYGCQNSDQPILDQTCSVFGNVKSEDGTIIDSCIVGFVNSNVDSTNIVNDSLFIQNAEIFEYSSNGHYRIDWFLGPVPLPYDRMYAIKKGFLLWHYDRERDIINNIGKYTDSLTIVLKENNILN